MRKLRFLSVVLAVLLFLPIVADAQNIVRVPPFTGANFLNSFISGDTLANGTRRDTNAVYVLTRGAAYASNAVITNTGWTFRLRANDTTGNVSRPVVFLYPGTAGTPPGQFVTMRGDVTMKNIILSGYFEPIPGNLSGLQGALFNTGVAGLNLTLDSCILTNTNGNHVRTDQAPRTIRITNCVFGNMGYLGRSNLGAGKGIDVRAGSVDSLIVLNNTFVNWQDRIIRHFASTAPIKYLRFEHNTCAVGGSYHGFLSLGGVGKRVIIRDNLLVDHFAFGNDTDAVRQAEFTDSGELDRFGFPRMTWIIANPNDTTSWLIKNNYYRVSAACQSFYDSASFLPIIANPALTVGSPLTYKINSRIGADSATAFRTHTADLPSIPRFPKEFLKWYRRPQPGVPDSGAAKTKATGMWKPQYDYDRKSYQWLRDTLNCTYATSNAVYTAGTGGYPVGDLNWFPTRYAAWKLDPVSGIERTINGIPSSFTLHQNYPNPFNPATRISFNVPRGGYTTLTVFNILGQKVAVPLAENLDAGFHEMDFDASHLTTGVYFYKLETGNNAAVKKMMLMK